MDGFGTFWVLVVITLSASSWWQPENVCAASDVDKHMFTSFPNLLKLYYMEEESLSNVDVYLREEYYEHGDKEAAESAHNLTTLRKLVEEAKETHRRVGENTTEYLSHPVNVFHLASRLHRGWKATIDMIRNSKPCREWHIPNVLSRLLNIENNLPSEADLTSVAYSLFTIQHTQRIRTQDLVEGRLGGHKSLAPISLQDQFRLAKLAVEEDDYFYAAQWLKCLSKSPKLKDLTRKEDGFNATNVLGMLASAYFRINMVPEALKATNELLKTDPENMVALANKVYFENRIANKKKSGQPIRFGKEDAYRKSFEKLCRGTNIKLSTLKCRLEPAWPGSRISFHKLEILKRRPPIVAIHGVLSRRDAQEIVSVSEQETEKAAMDTEEGFQTPKFTLSLSTVAKKHLRQLLARVKVKLSNLPYTVTQPFQSGRSEARNFGHQGFYIKPSPGFEIKTLGGHTGTAIVFLNDVEMGGDVVFPSANTRVSPQVGTVLFYFPSMKKFHTVCPVAYGTEWLLLHSFFQKPAHLFCRLNEDPALL